MWYLGAAPQRRNEGVSSVVDTVLEKLGESSRKLPIKGGEESTQDVYEVYESRKRATCDVQRRSDVRRAAA